MQTDATDISSDAVLPELVGQALLRERIDYLYRNTDFALTLFRNLTAYAIVAADFDGNVVAFNEGARRAFGYTPEEVIGRRRIDIFFPREFVETGKLQEAVAAVIGNEQFSYEGEMLKSGDQRFPVHAVLTLTKDMNGRMVGIVLVAEDITERKLVQESIQKLNAELEQRVAERTAALAESEEKLRITMETARDAIVVVEGEHGTITSWNPAAEAIFGYSRDEIVGRPIHEILPPPRFRESALRGMAHFAQTGEGAAIGKTLELAALHKNGTEFPIALSLSAMQIHGKWHASGIARDISERKQRETELRAIAKRLNEAERVAKIGFLDWNLITNEVEVSDETLRIYGLAPGRNKLAFEEITKRVHPDDVRYAVESLHNAIETGTRHDIEHRIVRTDGTVVYVHTPAEIMRDADGKPISALGTVQDITERKEHEALIVNLNIALRILSASNSVLIHAQTEEELCQSVCRHIVEIGSYRLAWVEYPGAEADAPRFVGYFGDEALCQMALRPEHPSRCLTAAALRTRQAQVWNKLHEMPECSSAQLRELGMEAILALPLICDDQLHGALTVFSPLAKSFGADDIKLMEELAADLAFGVTTLRTRTARDLGVKRERAQVAELRQALEQTIVAIGLVLEKRDPYTSGHQQRVAEIASAIANEMGLSPQQIEGIHFGALIHDIGKVYVPAEILSRPGKLSELEFGMIKTHAQVGHDIVKDIPFPWPVAQMVHQHHERLDGSGYPQGLKGDAILLEARILAVADVVEAMSSHRPYRAALGLDAAMKELERGRGTAYDAVVVDACANLLPKEKVSTAMARSAMPPPSW